MSGSRCTISITERLVPLSEANTLPVMSRPAQRLSFIKRTVLEPEWSKTRLSVPFLLEFSSCSHFVILPVTIFLISSRVMRESGQFLFTMSATASVAMSDCLAPSVWAFMISSSLGRSLRVTTQQRRLSASKRRRAESSLQYTGFIPASGCIMPKVSTSSCMIGANVSSIATFTSSSASQLLVAFLLPPQPTISKKAAMMDKRKRKHFFMVGVILIFVSSAHISYLYIMKRNTLY